MPWKYKDGTIKRIGRSWKDEDGTVHPYNWDIWSDEDKAAHDLAWEDE